MYYVYKMCFDFKILTFNQIDTIRIYVKCNIFKKSVRKGIIFLTAIFWNDWTLLNFPMFKCFNKVLYICRLAFKEVNLLKIKCLSINYELVAGCSGITFYFYYTYVRRWSSIRPMYFTAGEECRRD